MKNKIILVTLIQLAGFLTAINSLAFERSFLGTYDVVTPQTPVWASRGPGSINVVERNGVIQIENNLYNDTKVIKAVYEIESEIGCLGYYCDVSLKLIKRGVSVYSLGNSPRFNFFRGKATDTLTIEGPAAPGFDGRYELRKR